MLSKDFKILIIFFESFVMYFIYYNFPYLKKKKQTEPEDYFFSNLNEDIEDYLIERVKELYYINSQI